MQSGNRFDVLSGGIEDPNINDELRFQIEHLGTLSINEVFDLKTKVENELESLFDQLELQGADLNSSLVTPEGYPRSDVDVLQVRLLRRSINSLRHDLRDVIAKSQELLTKQFQILAAKTHQIEDDCRIREYRVPFALVTEVVPESPSQIAGLVEGDKIVRFGEIHAGNHRSLTAIGPLVKKSQDLPLLVRVLRHEQFFDLTLKPTNNWIGPGLLGCRLVHV
ncbi:LADA_0E12970g1_1 [Lachancea dasiensis]|uniref:Probable 26S proteasome regulatory subunit p27 n=1 Tax=Lachancea dasiensis TaxID=1072105 RepID=A0A1G4JFG5_9SACH|nr:LADA_0E12970g1_1 [Lachancea dasiensis]